VVYPYEAVTGFGTGFGIGAGPESDPPELELDPPELELDPPELVLLPVLPPVLPEVVLGLHMWYTALRQPLADIPQTGSELEGPAGHAGAVVYPFAQKSH